jgi:hypothetical protein
VGNILSQHHTIIAKAQQSSATRKPISMIEQLLFNFANKESPFPCVFATLVSVCAEILV